MFTTLENVSARAERSRELRQIVLDYVAPAPAVGKPPEYRAHARSALFEAMRVLWPYPSSPLTDREMRDCLMDLVRDRLVDRLPGVSTPGSSWAEPRFRDARRPVPTAPAAARTILSREERAQKDLVQRFRYRSHICERCKSKIPGSGRHGKSRRGHGKAECDLAMVGHLMSL